MAAPTAARRIEALLDTLGHTTKGHQRVPALGLAKNCIQNDPSAGTQHQAHGVPH